MMVVCETSHGEKVICNSKEEIANIIRRGSEFPEGDEIWIGAADDEYPFLTLLVKGPYACVHYYLNQDGCVWQSYSDFDQEITFLTEILSEIKLSKTNFSAYELPRRMFQYYGTYVGEIIDEENNELVCAVLSKWKGIYHWSAVYADLQSLEQGL